MVWPMETIDPLVAISSRVARNDVAVARRRDQRGMIGLAMQIDHESRHRGEDRGCIETFGKCARQRLGTDIDRDVEIEQLGRDPQRDAFGNHVRSVIAQQQDRSEEHTSELQSLMRISYAVFCLKKK